MSVPTILGTGSMTTPGWSLTHDYAPGADHTTRIRLCSGPARSLDLAAAELRTNLKILSLDPTVTTGSAIATLRAEYTTATGMNLTAGETRLPVYHITSLMEVVALAAHPKAKSITPHISKIEAIIATGDIPELKAYLKTLDGDIKTSATYFASLLLAGVTAYEKPALQLTCTLYFADPPNLTTEHTTINRIYTWATIKTNGRTIPSWVKEPKWVDTTDKPQPYSWRLTEITPTLQRRGENIVTWTYIGRDAYAKELYPGGTWEPEPLEGA